MKHVFTTVLVVALAAMMCIGSAWGADAKGDRDLLRSRTPAEGQAARARMNSTQALNPAAPGKLLAATVYVNAAWAAATGDPDGSGPATAMGVDAFAAIQEGIDAVDAGGTVNVYPGAYSETAANRLLYDGTGPYTFGLFFGAAKPGVTVRGVDGTGAPITSAAAAVAVVTTNSTANYGPDGIWVEGDNVTIAGLKILDNMNGAVINNNKTIEIIGNNVTIKHCWIAVTGGGSLYFNDWRFDAGTNTSHVQSYTLDGNILDAGGSIDLADGAGYSGPAAGRVITNNIFNITDGVYWAVISFNGSDTGVEWFIHSVGGAVITGNTFNGGAQHIIRARGTYDNAQFNWASYWTNNTFSKKVAYGTNPPAVLGTYSYTSGSYVFNNVRHIAGLVQQEIGYAQAGEKVLLGAGTYEEQLEVAKSLTLQGAGATTIVKAPATLPLSFTTSAANYPVVYAHDADGIVLKDLTVDGAGRGNANYRFVGIGYNNAGGSVENCTIKDIRNTPIDGSQHGVGILVNAAAGTARTFAFTGNTVIGFQKNATVFSGANLTATVANNTVTGAGSIAFTAQNGIQVYGVAGVEVSGNAVTGIAYTGADWTATGILVFGPGGAVNLSNNTVTGAQTGVYYIDAAGSIAGNTVDRNGAAVGNVGAYGIIADPGVPTRVKPQPYDEQPVPALKTGMQQRLASVNALVFSITRNVVTGSSASGVGIGCYSWDTETMTATLTENAVTGWAVGLEYYKDLTASLAVVAHGNSLSGNTKAIDDQYTGVTQDASGNWFGGDPAALVTPNIDYTPYLGSGVDADPMTPGFQPANLVLNVTTACPQSGSMSRIHEAIAMAASGATINVAAGSYVEGPQVVVNTNVSVVGVDKNTVIINPSANTGNGGDARGWFLVNAGKTFNLSGVTLDGAGKLVNIGILSKGPGTISGNILKNIGYNQSGPDYAGRGIAFYDANMTISDNALSTIGRIGIYMYGAGVTNGLITNNTFTGKGTGDWLDYGIEVEGAAHAVLTGNTVTECKGVASVDGSTSAGVLATTYFAAGTQVTATDNNFTDNTSALAIGYDGTDVTVATVSGNDFTGCEYGVTSSAPVVDARHNWWGDGSGPSGGATDPVTAAVANGTGVKSDAHVRFDPWNGKAENVNVPAAGNYSWPESGVTISFGTVPSGGGTVTVQRLIGMPPNPPYPVPPAGATYIPLWLMLSSSMPNYSFSATVTVDVSDIAGFGAGSQIMYLNSVTSTWVPVGGTYDAMAKTFTFTTTHFTPFAFVNTPATAFQLHLSSSAAAVNSGIYPNDAWALPAPLPANYPALANDWGYTSTQTFDVYIVPEAGTEFGAADLTLEWDAAHLAYSSVSFVGSLFAPGGNTLHASADQLGTNNRVRINASLQSPNNVTAVAGNYIAKLTLRTLKPGHSAITVIASDLRKYEGAGAPLGVYVTPHQADVRAYLGDVANSANDAAADGQINFSDLIPWSVAYWSGVPGYVNGMAYYKVKFDIGPTADHYVFSAPQVDGKIDFEDLIIFSISYGLSANHQLPKQAVEQAEPVTVAIGDVKAGGGETRVPVMLEGTFSDLRGLSMAFSGSHGRLLGVEKGALLSGYETPVPVMYCERDGKVYVDLAIAGAGVEALKSAGELVVLRFEGKASMGLTAADARTSTNAVLATKMRTPAVSDVPTEFALQQNFPNPFNPSTTVSYALPAPGEVRIAVFNVLGEQVASLVNGAQEAGYYTVQWNGTDNRGQQVTSGVYFLTMHAGEFTAMKKMMLVK